MKLATTSFLFALIAAQTPLEALKNSTDHSVLAGLVDQVPFLAEVLSIDGPLTLLAPSNKAFEKVPKDTLNAWKVDGYALVEVIYHHVLPNFLYLPEESDENVYPATMSGTRILLEQDQEVSVHTGLLSAKVEYSLPAGKGIVHSIDTVLTPPPAPSELLKLANLTGLLELLERADMVKTIDSATDVTILAPSNDAIAKWNASTKGEVSKQDLKSIISDHVLKKPSVFTAAIDAKMVTAETLNNNTVEFTFDDVNCDYTVKGLGTSAKIINTDVMVAQGVIQVIDTMLLVGEVVEETSTSLSTTTSIEETTAEATETAIVTTSILDTTTEIVDATETAQEPISTAIPDTLQVPTGTLAPYSTPIIPGVPGVILSSATSTFSLSVLSVLTLLFI
jgi:uncharacterized surface protein with fasciclin (FAS1) repeats